MGFLDIFKDKDENENRDDFMRKFAGMEENSNFDSKRDPEPAEEPSSYSQPAEESTSSQIGIGSLMDKRAKLEDAIDYVGLMVKNLKDKRTKLEKDIEDESVDIKNLKEKLSKINEFIQDENNGLEELTNKRAGVEKEADEVGNIIYGQRDKISGIDKILADEADKIKRFKESKSSSG